MRQTRVSIYIPVYVSYEYTKFSNDLSTLTEEDACRVGQSSTKIKFCTGTRHFSGPIYHLKMRFCLIFKYLIVFIICIWQRTKPSLHKDRSQKLISTTFSISDPLERELKIMTTFDQWIYTFMIVFYFCDLLLLQKGILSLFPFLTSFFGPERNSNILNNSVTWPHVSGILILNWSWSNWFNSIDYIQICDKKKAFCDVIEWRHNLFVISRAAKFPLWGQTQLNQVSPKLKKVLQNYNL